MPPIIRQDNRGAGLAVRSQAAVNVLQKVQLLVAGGEGEVIAGGPLAALLGAKGGGIGQYQIESGHLLAEIRQGIPQQDRAFERPPG